MSDVNYSTTTSLLIEYRALLLASCALLIVGFSRAADYGFGTPTSYGIIIAGAVVFVAAIVNFLMTKRNAIIPSRMFKNRTTLFFLLGSALHATAFIPSNFLLPQMLQGVRHTYPESSQFADNQYSFAVIHLLSQGFTCYPMPFLSLG